jgi:hypothetical protein
MTQPRLPLATGIGIAVVVAVVAATAVPSVASANSSRVAATPSCLRQLVRGRSFYTPINVHLKKSLLGGLLPGKGAVRCERPLVCLKDSPCAYHRGRLRGKTRVRGIRRIATSQALVDDKTRRVYVNLDTCAPTIAVRRTSFRCDDPATILGDPAQTLVTHTSAPAGTALPFPMASSAGRKQLV